MSKIGGYASAAYAASFSGRGRLLPLAHCGGFLIERTLPDGRHSDASSCYPMFSCVNWSRLQDDIAALTADLVSVALVSDPLAEITESELHGIFPWLRPLDDHYVVDLQIASERRICRHHGRKLRQAEKYGLHIGRVDDLAGFLPHWMELYGHLARKRSLTGLRLFSAQELQAQLMVPGTVVICAEQQDAILGADWYYLDGDRVYAHLSAYSEAGYACAVSYPMMQYALEYFSNSCRILDLGGVPGGRDRDGGLGYFKSGWSTHRLPTYVCGKVLDTQVYRSLTAGRPPADYFPLYRFGEYE